jgi:probable HAF family extracellular repeat protein
MLSQLSLNKDLASCEPILLSIPRKLSKRRVEPDVDCQPSRRHDSTGGKRDMRTLRQFRNFWPLWVATIVLACSSNAFAQASYKVADQGTLGDDNFGMVMGLNNQGWTQNMDGEGNPPVLSLSTTVLSGRAVMNIDGHNIDLGTLGGKNSWTNYGGINDRGENVGYAETSVLDPDGEDFCAFGTKLTCRGFYWRDGHIMALPTLGGNNAQAAAINNRGQIVGISETAVQDSGCPASKPGKIISPALWEKGEVRALPTVYGDPDGFVQGINDQGQAVGSSGTCTGIAAHAVLWENDTAVELKGLGGRTGNAAYAINDHGQAVGYVTSSDGSTIVPSIWHESGLTTLPILPGDGAAFATGINNRGQVVGSTFKSGSWSHGFIGEDGVVTDLNTLIPEDSNLFIVAASNINERGQISGMAQVVTGPNAGKIHAILLTPSNESISRSVADAVRTRPGSILPASAHSHHSPSFELGRIGQ